MTKKVDLIIPGRMVSGSFSGILEHVGHKVYCTYYGKDPDKKGGRERAVNAAIECQDCQCVIVDFEKE